MGVNEISGCASNFKPFALPRRGVQIECCLAHGERIAEIGAATVLVAVTESTVLDAPVGEDPARCRLGSCERGRIAGRGMIGSKPADGPSVLARVDVHVDAGLPAELPAFCV